MEVQSVRAWRTKPRASPEPNNGKSIDGVVNWLAITTSKTVWRSGGHGAASEFHMERVAPRPGRTKTEESAVPLPSLTPLRGIAALWVVLFHYSSVYFPSLDTDGYSHIISKGYIAVDMFFMLSGFVLAHVYQKAFCESISHHYRSFLIARVARLYPLHLFILLLFVATASTLGLIEYAATGSFPGIRLEGPRSLTAFFANLFMLQGLAASKLSWNYPSWSISVEFIAYLLFPIVLPTIWRAPAGAKLGLALVLAEILGVFAYSTGDDFNQWNGPETLVRCLPEFLLGTLLYYVFRSGICASFLDRDAVAAVLVLTSLLCLHFGWSDILIIPLFAAMMLAAVVSTGKFTTILNVGPLIWLGDISFSLYLIHGFVQYVTTISLGKFGIENLADLTRGYSLGLMILMLAVCLLSATMTYRLEVSARRYLRAVLGDQKRHRAAPARLPNRAAPPPILVFERAAGSPP